MSHPCPPRAPRALIFGPASGANGLWVTQGLVTQGGEVVLLVTLEATWRATFRPKVIKTLAR